MSFGLVNLYACSAPSQEVEEVDFIVLTNPGDMDRKDEPVLIGKDKLQEIIGEIPQGKVPLFENAEGTAFPSQVDDLDLDGEWDEVALLVSLPANGKDTLYIKLVDEAQVPGFPNRTNVYFGTMESEDDVLKPVTRLVLPKQLPGVQLNQMDGPAWENDKVGFRLYFDGGMPGMYLEKLPMKWFWTT